jgi:hypothetical protein
MILSRPLTRPSAHPEWLLRDVMMPLPMREG